MHKMRFAEPEEDDGFFVYTFVTEAIYLLFPYVRALWGLALQTTFHPANAAASCATTAPAFSDTFI